MVSETGVTPGVVISLPSSPVAVLGCSYTDGKGAINPQGDSAYVREVTGSHIWNQAVGQSGDEWVKFLRTGLGVLVWWFLQTHRIPQPSG